MYCKQAIINNMQYYKPFVCIALVCLLFAVTSCTQQKGVFEKNTSIPSYAWKKMQVIKGKFEITDTTSRYKLYVVLRHTDAYRYNNIWLHINLQGPGDSISQKIDMPLGTDATGWYGSGMNDIWELRHLLETGHRFKKGIFGYSIQQVMREAPLPEVMSVGFRVEKMTAP